MTTMSFAYLESKLGGPLSYFVIPKISDRIFWMVSGVQFETTFC